MRGKKTSQYRGVHGHGEKWKARLVVSDATVNLGTFKEEIEAARAYDRGVLNHFPEFSRMLNFPVAEYHFVVKGAQDDQADQKAIRELARRLKVSPHLMQAGETRAARVLRSRHRKGAPLQQRHAGANRGAQGLPALRASRGPAFCLPGGAPEGTKNLTRIIVVTTTLKPASFDVATPSGSDRRALERFGVFVDEHVRRMYGFQGDGSKHEWHIEAPTPAESAQ